MTPDQKIRQSYAAFQGGRLAEAEHGAHEVLRQSPKHVNAIALLGLISFQRGQFEQALIFQQRVIDHDPRAPEHRCNIGFTLLELGRFDEAIDAFGRGRQRDTRALADTGIATAHERAGDTERAIETLAPYRDRDALTDGMGAVLTTALLRRKALDEVIELAATWTSRTPDNAAAYRRILFNLGHAYDRRADTDDAFAMFERANAVIPASFDPVQHRQYAGQLRRAFEALDPTLMSNESSDRQVFIVGLPRSGSTLIEQILHAHPDGFGVGETPAMLTALHDIGPTIAQPGAYPSYLDSFRRGHLDLLAHAYLDRLPEHPQTARRLIDKALPNYLHVPIIRRLFPRATIIHARRHPLDICLSCFMQNLSPVTHPYTTRLDWLADVHEVYDDWMHRLQDDEALGIVPVMYERLVNDFDLGAHRLVRAIGLQWDDSCAAFHRATRLVTTLSYEQVRQPIYTAALARHDRYATHLRAVRDRLGDACERYEAELNADASDGERG